MREAVRMDLKCVTANDISRGLPADTPAWEAELPSQVRNEAGASLRGELRYEGRFVTRGCAGAHIFLNLGETLRPSRETS